MLLQRKTYLNQITQAIKSMPITVLIGARQVGKTSLLSSIDLQASYYKFDGQLPENNELFNKYEDVVSLLQIKLNHELNGILIIDEFQMIRNIAATLKILVDTYPNLKVLCSGSSSLDIIQKVEESLAGRVRMLYVNSLSFSESILFTDKDLFTEYKGYHKETGVAVISKKIKNLLNTHLIYGGMPRVWLTNDSEEKIQVLYDIYTTYLLRDVRSYVKNADSVGFNKLLRMLALQIGNLVNVNELSRSTGLTYHKCEEYLYLLEQMFIIKLVGPYETNKRKAIKKMKKVYFLDLGIRNIIIKNFNAPDSRTDAGALFENFVFLELLKNKKSYTEILFYRTSDGAEVDFVLNDMQSITSIEIKYKSLKKPMYNKSLAGFNKDENVKKSYIVNLYLQKTHHTIKYITPYLIEKHNIS